MSKTVGIIIWALFAAIPGTFLVLGGYLAWDQGARIQRSVPLQATVTGTEVERTTDSEGDVSYTPKVTHRFAYEGKTYSNTKVFPIRFSTSSSSWAEGVIGQYHSGDTITVWVDPQNLDNHKRSFIVRKASFFPYIFVMVGGLLLPLFGLAKAMGKRKVPEPMPGESGSEWDGWYQLSPERSQKESIQSAAIWSIVLPIPGLIATTHFLWIGTGFDTAAWICLPIYAALTSIPWTMLFRRSWAARHVAQPIVAIAEPNPTMGQSLALYVEQPIVRACLINKVTATLVREHTTRTTSGGKTRISTNTTEHGEHTLIEGKQALEGDHLFLDAVINLPNNPEPSSPPDNKGYPHTRWLLAIHTDIAGSPDFKTRCPIMLSRPRK